MKKQIIDTDAVATPGPMTKNPYQNSTPMRGLETHVEGSMGMNHMEASGSTERVSLSVRKVTSPITLTPFLEALLALEWVLPQGISNAR